MKKIMYISLCSLLLLSCEDDIIIDIIREEPKVVVHAYFEREKPMSADLVRSVPIPLSVDYDRASYHITDAEVNVYENDAMLGTMTHQGEGKYLLDYTPVEDRFYSIEVIDDGLSEIITDVQILPALPVINDYQFIHQSVENDQGNFSIEHSLTLRNNPAEKAYYKISLDIRAKHYRNGELEREEIINWYRLTSGNPALKDYTCLEGCYGDTGNMKALYFSNETFGGSPEINLLLNTDYFRDYEISYPNETIKTEYVQSIQVSKISRSMMDYARSIFDNSNANQIFQEPVTIVSNIRGGFGVFGTLSSVHLPYQITE